MAADTVKALGGIKSRVGWRDLSAHHASLSFFPRAMLKRDCRIPKQRNRGAFQLKSQAETALWSLSDPKDRDFAPKAAKFWKFSIGC